MNLSDYRVFVKQTKTYPEEAYGIIYPALGLAGEAGEVANKIKKLLRDGGFEDIRNNFPNVEDKKKAIVDEMGDVLWYLSSLADDLDMDLQEILDANVTKLISRRERGVLKGNGDNR